MKHANDLGNDKVSSLVLRLAIPSMLSQLVNVLYGIIDRMFIGHIPIIGNLALAGVGVCGPIVTLLSSFGTLVGIGGSIMMAMKMGEGKKEDAKDILSNSFLMLVIFSTVLTAFFLLTKRYMINWFGGSPLTYEYANTYLTIYTIGTFFALLAIGLNYFITCQGFALIGMMTVFVGAISNIILDAVFIFVFKLGVAGAAWATVISQFISCICALIFLFGKRVPIKITFANYKFSIIKKILSIGLSPFIIIATDSVIIIAMNSVLQKYGGSQGDVLISAATILQSYFLLITGPLIGISGGTQPIISYNYGAKNIERVKQSEKYIAYLALALTTSMFIISQVFPVYFVRLFTNNVETVKLATWGIKVFTLAIIPLTFQYIFVDALTALGRIKTALFLSMFRKSIYLISVFILPVFFVAKYAFFAQPIADLISSVLSVIVFLKIFDKHLENRLCE
ncbi:MAG: MATE family efflux transporter [Oscillospiraceae bacterium]